MAEVLIIGAGPAGLAAALQLKRRGVDFILFERQQVGGLLNNANLVENYPGFPGGIAGTALVERFHQQVMELGIAINYEDLTCLDYSAENFHAKTPRNEYLAPIAIVATGTVGNTPEEITTPPELRNRVLTEILPIMSLNGKRVVIIGAGDLAFDYALNLGRRNEVLILNRSGERKCLPLLWERAGRLPDVSYREQTQLTGLEMSDTSGLNLHVVSQEHQVIACDYLVYAIGRRPNISFQSEHVFQKANDLELRGLLHYIGDVSNGIYRQAAIAVGDGILAAMQIIRKLEGRDR